VKTKFFKKYLDAKKFAQKKNGKTVPVYKIGPMGGKNFLGYDVKY
jgi:hypothetical protein